MTRNTIFPSLTVALLIVSFTYGFMSGLSLREAYSQNSQPDPADSEQLVEALRQLNAIANPESQSSPNSEALSPTEPPAETINELPTSVQPAEISTTPVAPPEAEPMPTQETQSDSQSSESLPVDSRGDPTPVFPPSVPDNASVPEPVSSVGQPIDVGNTLGLPLLTDPRVAIARDQSLLLLARDFIQTLNEIHENDHHQPLLALLRATHPDDTALYDTVYRLIGLLEMQSQTELDSFDSELTALEDLIRRAENIATLDSENTDSEPITIIPEPVLSTPPRIVFDIVPVTAQVNTEWGQSEKAIIMINRRRHVLWPGDTIDDPNGDPVTLLRVESEGPQQNPLHRVVVEHNGVEIALPWPWE